MNGRQRLATTLSHRTPDRVCVDFGATPVTGIHVSAVTRLRRAVLDDPDQRVKVIEPYQMLGEVDDDLRRALGIDVIGVAPRLSMFATEQKDWKPLTLFDGTKVLIPGGLQITVDPETGDWLAYPAGDTSVTASGRMTKEGYFFDAIIRQEPIEEARLDPSDNMEEFGLLSNADRAYYLHAAEWLDAHADCGVVLAIPGAAFGDIALVPATFLKHPKGIRDIKEWYISLAKRPDYITAVFERQCEYAEKNIATLIEIFGERVQVALLTGTDFGMQTGPLLSNQMYRRLFKPLHTRLNRLIHEKSSWKTFIHSCGSVYRLIPEFIEAGFDILNPVQCSATDMDPRRLKQEFGAELVFWGGGVNTQHTIAFGSANDVYREVRQRIDVFGAGGGYVFNSIHNIQANTPPDNILAMFRAIRDSYR
ncbi:MAG: uroporphyrinogen decarboxylase family protein [Planctomycetes bacterium]|nr:uroporphyrinogen decarboxylase family protein [Planctomycetota bacterium]